MTTTTPAAPEKPQRTKKPLASYDAPEGPRVIVGHGTRYGRGYIYERLVDVPVNGRGGLYEIERGRWIREELEPLLEDYLAQASELGHCPMSRAAIDAMLARGARQREAIS